MLALDPNNGKIKWGFQYTPNDPYDYDEISEHPLINATVNGEKRKLVVHGARNGFYYALDRTNGSFVAGKQYVDELTWTNGLDPKTGKPVNYDPTKIADLRAGLARHARQTRRSRTCRRRRQELGAGSLQSGTNLIFIPSIGRLQHRRGHEQKDFVDQGGPSRRASVSPAAGPRSPSSQRQHQSARPGDRRNQGSGEDRLSELAGARDRRQLVFPGLWTAPSGPMTGGQ